MQSLFPVLCNKSGRWSLLHGYMIILISSNICVTDMTLSIEIKIEKES